MSLGSVLSSAASGLLTSQTQLRVISDNIGNVNTPGYVRRTVDQNSVSLASAGGGVSVGRISRSVDLFLQKANQSANADMGAADVVGAMMDRAQSLFGDPTESGAYFNQLDGIFSAFSAAAEDPASSVTRNQTLTTISNFLDQSGAISSQLKQLSTEADSRISANVGQINDLLGQIDDFNSSLIRGTVSGSDITGAQNSQGQLIDKLSSLIDITVSTRVDGAIDVRSGDGTLLVGRGGTATLSFSTSSTGLGQLSANSPGGGPRALEPKSGALKGLLDVANTKIPAIGAQLGEYVTRAVDELNRAHNASSAAPPPNLLTGRDMGMDLSTAVSGFTGKTTVAVVNSAGVLQTKVDIDFDAGTMSVDGAAPTGFSASSFATDLSAALGASGSASFSSGKLSIQASAGNGIAIGDDAATPSSKAGRGFSHFFGLNDLITSDTTPYTATGLKGSDPNGMATGGVITVRIIDPSGAGVRDTSVSVPSPGTVDDLINALNSNSNGVGLFGAYSLDSEGRMSFSPSQPGYSISMLADSSAGSSGGPSVTELFGIDPARGASRAGSFHVRPDIGADSANLALAQLNSTVTPGQSALSKGDARGGLKLAAAGDTAARFDAAGYIGSLSATLSQYGAQFSGSVAQQSAAAVNAATQADAVSTEAAKRRSSVEGVNLDEEMINLTTYQQSYAASARMIQAVKEMYDVLLNMM